MKDEEIKERDFSAFILPPSSFHFFAAYVSTSMNPTLQEPELMEIAPYGERQMQVGDVILFRRTEEVCPVVHRIVRLTPEGIRTRGDNNSREDGYFLQPGEVAGRVVAAWHGQRRREIAGGRTGRLIACWLSLRRALYLPLTRLLHPIYHALSRRGILARLLPGSLRPQVVAFQTERGSQYRLLLGRRVIGRYDARRDKWLIQKPFRLLVDEQTLKEGGRVKDEG